MTRAFAGRIAGGAVTALLAATAACRPNLSQEDCALMLDRYVEMRIDADPALAHLTPAQSAVVRDERKQAERVTPAYTRALAQCTAEVSRSEWTCAMQAPGPNEWEACID